MCSFLPREIAERLKGLKGSFTPKPGVNTVTLHIHVSASTPNRQDIEDIVRKNLSRGIKNGLNIGARR